MLSANALKAFLKLILSNCDFDKIAVTFSKRAVYSSLVTGLLLASSLLLCDYELVDCRQILFTVSIGCRSLHIDPIHLVLQSQIRIIRGVVDLMYCLSIFP